MAILNETMTNLYEFREVFATHFLYGTQAQWAYENDHIDPAQTQLIMSLGRADRFIETKYHSDATFSYELYHYHNKRSRFKEPKNKNYPSYTMMSILSSGTNYACVQKASVRLRF